MSLHVYRISGGKYVNLGEVKQFHVTRAFSDGCWAMKADDKTLRDGYETEEQAEAALATLLEEIRATVLYG